MTVEVDELGYPTLLGGGRPATIRRPGEGKIEGLLRSAAASAPDEVRLALQEGQRLPFEPIRLLHKRRSGATLTRDQERKLATDDELGPWWAAHPASPLLPAGGCDVGTAIGNSLACVAADAVAPGPKRLPPKKRIDELTRLAYEQLNRYRH